MTTKKRIRRPIQPVFSSDLVAALRFDRYVASVPAATMEQLAQLFVDCGDDIRTHKRQTRSGTIFGYHYYDERRKRVGSVYLKRGIASLEMKGATTPLIVERLRARFEHCVWNADVCLDSHGGITEYNELMTALESVKTGDSRLQGVEITDKDHPERGARYYLGMQESPGSVCMYRKGLQPGYRNKGLDEWNRTEWRLKMDKDFRELASNLDPLDILALNATTRKVAAAVLGVSLARVGKSPKLGSKPIQTLEYVCNTFPTTLRKAAELIGGTDKVLAKLGFAIDGNRWICVRQQDYVLNRTMGIDVHTARSWLKTMIERSKSHPTMRPMGEIPALTYLTLDLGFSEAYPLAM